LGDDDFLGGGSGGLRGLGRVGQRVADAGVDAVDVGQVPSEIGRRHMVLFTAVNVAEFQPTTLVVEASGLFVIKGGAVHAVVERLDFPIGVQVDQHLLLGVARVAQRERGAALTGGGLGDVVADQRGGQLQHAGVVLLGLP